MSLASGTKLGPYEITGALGAGGMGEVYRARDTRLERDVAIKVLPASYSADPDRLRRFEQEARAASQLNHPNIVVVHDFGSHEGSPYVVQELLEGETLRGRLEPGPLAARKATEYALEVARGLAAAHDKGIAHRDLKPENIFITTDGRVKILDFGLAKLTAREAENLSSARTATVATLPGVIMGTAGYMSPEQVRAQPTDARTDIFSFGAILYEMLTGRRAFERPTSAETMTAILREEPPDVSTLAAAVPPPLERVVNHCLEKSPELRFQSAKDLAFALGSLSGSGTAAALPAMGKSRRRAWAPWVALAAVAICGTFAAYLFLNRAAPAERMEFAIPVQNEVSNLALSADGRMLAYVARDDASGENMLYFERLGAAGATRLAGTEGVSYPFWSPDDAYIGFFANGKLKKVSISGGDPQIIASASYGRGGTWNSHGVIVYAPDTGGPLWRVNADGTSAEPLTDKIFTKGENSHRWPLFLPDNKHFLFWAGSFGASETRTANGIYLGSPGGNLKKLVVSAMSNAGYAGGYLYYVNERKSLIVVPVNLSSPAISGEPVVVAGLITYQPSVLWGAFAAGGNGTVVYSTSNGAVHSVLTWYDRSGKALGQIGEPGVMANPSVSPDGTHVAVDIADLKGNGIDVWIQDLLHNTSSRFTFQHAEEVVGVWSRDGQRIAYRSIATGSSSLNVKNATGLETQKQIYAAAAGDDIMPNSWSADDQSILCSYQPGAGGSNLVVVDVATGKLRPFIAINGSATNGQISPDGKWEAYASNESGDWEIYVTTFPGAQGKWQVSRGGGTEPRWQNDGKEIYYIDPKGMLTAVPVRTDGAFSAGAPAPLFPIRGRASISSTDLYTYDVSRDSKRFLVNSYVKPDHVEPLTVVLNATAGTGK